MHVTPEVKARITALFAGYATIIKTKYGIDLPAPNVSYDIKGTDGGRANGGKWTIRFNPVLLMQNIEAYLERTVPHEYAHLACHKIYPDAHKTTIMFSKAGGAKRTKRDIHGPRWQSIMHALGAAASRCHKYDVTDVKRKVAKHTYRCSRCQATLELGPKLHAQLRRDPDSRWHKNCKGHKLVYVGNATPAAPVTPRVVQPTPATPQAPLDGSKLDRCMAIYKANRFLDRAAMIRLFTGQVGMTAAGASTYYYKCKG